MTTAMKLDDVHYEDTIVLDLEGGQSVEMEINMAMDAYGQLLEDPWEAKMLICEDASGYLYEVLTESMQVSWITVH